MTRRRGHKSSQAGPQQTQSQQQLHHHAFVKVDASHHQSTMHGNMNSLTAQFRDLCVSTPSKQADKATLSRPRLPLEIVEQIFQALHDELNPIDRPWWETAQASNSRFVKMSLVCKSWYTAASKFRTTLVLGSEKSAKQFMNRMKKVPMQFKKLHYSCTLSTETLEKLTSFVSSGNLVGLSLPLSMLQTKHVHDLLKKNLNPVASVHVYGKISEDYSGTWWQKAYILHDIPTLRELTLTNIKIKGSFRAFQASVKSPIERLHLVGLESGLTAESVRHLCWPLVYTVKHFTCIGVDYMTLCAIMHILVTPHLESFESKSTFSHYLGSANDTNATAYSKVASWKTVPYHLKVDLANSGTLCDGEVVDEDASAHFIAALTFTQFAAIANGDQVWRGLDILFPTVLRPTVPTNVVYNELPNRIETRSVLNTAQEERLRNAWALLNNASGTVGIRRVSEDPAIYEFSDMLSINEGD